MSETIRQMIEKGEKVWLSTYAQLAAESAGRDREEPPDPIRTCFMRDRDRVLHAKSFRRLKHKTQVYIDPQGDHFRTRLTHTLEVSQIARTIARALRLNEDLTEAIALGHDVGHTPFGHAGESALDEAIREKVSGTRSEVSGPTSFRHYEQSLRMLQVLENLNLTKEVQLGIGGHSKGRKDLSDADGEPTSTLEAAVVRVADRIAYLNHDIDDALRSGTISEVPQRFQEIGETQGKRIGAMVEDVVAQSLDRPAITISPTMLRQMNDLKEWLFENVYENDSARHPEIRNAQEIVKRLFVHYCEPENSPPGFVGMQGAVDYVAGMTDRFALENYAAIFPDDASSL